MTQYIKTVLEVDATKAIGGFKQGEDAANRYASGLDKAAGVSDRSKGRLGALGDSIQKNRADWDRAGNSALLAGGAMAAGLGLAAKAAIDWDSAWAGVEKTVNGSTTEMAELEQGLRGLATELPATHTEIAGVAEAAGQLGVARGDVLDFTETAVGLGEATNLSAEQAATSLARISNVMGTTADYGIEGIERMGSTLVALGNNSATTESEILAMAQRLAGAGETAGATEADVLALAASLSSVGVEAQLGGGAMSRAMLQMNSAVLAGGEDLQAFADVAGMSAQEFATSWRENPVQAVGEFVAGLGRINDEGGDAAAALDDVGLKGTENAQVMLRAAGASDLLTESLELGADAWEANTALQEEASKRYETDASKIQIATNSMKDAAIDAGAAFGPMLAGAAGLAADAADQFVKLPDPLQKTASGLAAVSAASLLVGGGAIKAVGFAQDMGESLEAISGRSPRAAKGLRGVAKAGGALAVLGVASVAVGALQDAFQEAVPEADALALALENLHESGDLSEINEGIQNLDAKRSSASAVSIRDMGEAVEFLNNQTAQDKVRDWISGIGPLESDVDRLTEYVAGLDQGLADMYDQDPTKARETWAEMVVGVRQAGGSIDDLRAKYPLAAAAAERAARDGGEYEEHLAKVEQEAAAAEDALSDLQNQLEMLGGGFRAEQAANRQLNDSLVEMREIVKDSESDWDDLSGVMSQSADDALAVASAQVAQGRGASEVASGIAEVREQVIQAGVDAGRGREFMEGYADSIGLIPEDAYTLVQANGAKESRAAVLALDEQILDLDGKTVSVREAGAKAAKGNVLEFDGALFGLPPGKEVKVREIGTTAAGDKVVKFRDQIYTIPPTRNVDVTATVSGLSGLAALEARVSRLSGARVEVAMGTYKAQKYGGIEYHDTPHPMAGGGLIGGGTQLPAGTLSPGIYPTSNAGIWMAEDTSAPWELYASGRSDLRGRSRSIMEEGVGMLGGQVEWVTPMAQGGMTGPQHFSRHYTPVTPSVTVQAPAAAGSSSEVTQIIENLHGLTLESVLRETKSAERLNNLSGRRTD